LPDRVPRADEVHTIVFDFDGVFTDNRVWVDAEGRETVRCDRADGLAIDLLRAAQRRGSLVAEAFILSTEANPVVRARADKLRMACHQGVGDKLAFLTEHLETRFPGEMEPFQGAVFLGNDLNDLALLRRVGWSVAPSDAHPIVLEAVDVVLEERGGESFVRRFVERMLGVDHMTREEVEELVSDR